MIYQVGKKQCSNSGRKRNDIDPLESDLIVQPPSPLEFPVSLTPPTPLEFPIPSVVGGFVILFLCFVGGHLETRDLGLHIWWQWQVVVG